MCIYFGMIVSQKVRRGSKRGKENLSIVDNWPDRERRSSLCDVGKEDSSETAETQSSSCGNLINHPSIRVSYRPILTMLFGNKSNYECR